MNPMMPGTGIGRTGTQTQNSIVSSSCFALIIDRLNAIVNVCTKDYSKVFV